MDSVLTCMVTDKIGPGKVAENLAQEVAAYLQLAGGMAFVSYGRALKAALKVLKLAPGDRVAVSALSPSIHQTVLLELRLVPVVIDVDEETRCLSKQAIESCREDLQAILFSHTLGYLPDMEGLESLDIPLIEDITQCLGGEREERRCGGSGDLSVLSLGHEGIITGGTGGIVLSRSRSIVKQLGESENAADLSDLNASLALAQLKEIDVFLARRMEIYRAFRQSVMKSRHDVLFRGDDVLPYSFPLLVETDAKAVIGYAKKNDIEVVPAFRDSILNYLEATSYPPTAHKLSLRCLLFPLYPMLGRKHVESICRVLATLP